MGGWCEWGSEPKKETNARKRPTMCVVPTTTTITSFRPTHHQACMRCIAKCKHQAVHVRTNALTLLVVTVLVVPLGALMCACLRWQSEINKTPRKTTVSNETKVRKRMCACANDGVYRVTSLPDTNPRRLSLRTNTPAHTLAHATIDLTDMTVIAIVGLD